MIKNKSTKTEQIPAEVEPVEDVEEQEVEEGSGTKDLRIFSAKAIGAWRDYYVRQPASAGDRIIANPDAPVIFDKKVIGRLVDFTVTVPSTTRVTVRRVRSWPSVTSAWVPGRPRPPWLSSAERTPRRTPSRR